MKMFGAVHGALLAISASCICPGRSEAGGLEKFVRGFEAPVFIGDDGTDRLFVIEQRGKIRIVRNGEVVPKPFLDIRKEVDYGGEKGLLGLAFHPDFGQKRPLLRRFHRRPSKLLTVIAEFSCRSEIGRG